MLLSFNKSNYFKEADIARKARTEIEHLAEQLHGENYSNIVFTGVGGTTAIFESLLRLVQDFSDVEIYNLNAAELLVNGHPRINNKTLIITGSTSGDTKETVEVIKKYASSNNVFSITTKKDAPVARFSTHVIISDTEEVEFTYQQFYYFVFKLLELRGNFNKYEDFANQLDGVSKTLVSVREQFENRASEIAKVHYYDEYEIWVGSGENWGDVYLFSMCMLEECQWMRTKSVTSPEFFHGTLELTDHKTPIFLIVGIGNYRQLDLRVKRFLDKHSKNSVIIDLADINIDNFSDEFKYLLSPMLVEVITTDRLAKHYEKLSGHDLDTRRYYRQMDY